MSSRYSANQFEGAFRSQRLQNWCESRPGGERPTAQEGHTSFIADDRGHLLPGVKRGSAWPDFRGTWDLPARVPVPHVNLTGRSEAGLRRLRAWGLDPQLSNSSGTAGGSRRASRLQDAVESDEAAQEEGADPPSSAARPASADRPPTTGSQDQDCETVRCPGPDGGPADRPLSSAAAPQDPQDPQHPPGRDSARPSRSCRE